MDILTSGTIQSKSFGIYLTHLGRLRVHSKQEWSDLYSDESTQDLRKFFDYFTKGVKNGWPSTAPVRVSLLPFNDVSSAVLYISIRD